MGKIKTSVKITPKKTRPVKPDTSGGSFPIKIIADKAK